MKKQPKIVWTPEKFDPVVQDLIKYGKLLTYRRNTIFKYTKQESSQFFVVISGRFRVFTCKRKNKERKRTLWYCNPGEFMGENTLFNNSYSTSIQALVNSSCYTLDKELAIKSAQNIPDFANMLLQSLLIHTENYLKRKAK